MPNVTTLREAVAIEQISAWEDKRQRAFRLWQRESVLPVLNVWWRRNKYRVLALIDERIFFWNQESKDKEKSDG